MNILVTGGLGAIGSWITRAVISAGHRPVVLDMGTDFHLVDDIRDRCEWVEGDVTHLPTLIETIARHRVERVIHAAALMPPACKARPDLGLAVNVGGALAVLEASRLSNIRRVVCFSSKGVYGAIPAPHCHPDYVPVPETFRLAPQSIYDGTKVMVERLADNFRERFGLSVVCLRMATTFGPGKTRHGELSIHSRMIDAALAGEPVRIPQGGEESSDLIFNRDVGRAAVAAVLCDGGESGVYNVGTGRAVRFSDFAQWVLKAVPHARIEVGPGLNYMKQAHPTYCVLDVNRAATELGFAAEFVGEAAVSAYFEAAQLLNRKPA